MRDFILSETLCFATALRCSPLRAWGEVVCHGIGRERRRIRSGERNERNRKGECEKISSTE